MLKDYMVRHFLKKIKKHKKHVCFNSTYFGSPSTSFGINYFLQHLKKFLEF